MMLQWGRILIVANAKSLIYKDTVEKAKIVPYKEKFYLDWSLYKSYGSQKTLNERVNM